MFGGSQSHAFSCKHEAHDLLTLASYYVSIQKLPAFIKHKFTANDPAMQQADEKGRHVRDLHGRIGRLDRLME